MGCGSSTEAKKADKHPNRKYLPGTNQNFGGYELPSTGPLNPKEYKERLDTSNGTISYTLPSSGFSIRYAYVSQRGYYPDAPHKVNQDAYYVETCFNGDSEQLFFGVFDGHGEFGTQCAQFARSRVSPC